MAGSTAATALTWLGTVRRYSSVGWPSKPKYCSAMGKPMKAMVSIWVTSSTGFRMPTTVNQCPPIHTWVGWARLLMPSRLAASAPRTTAG